jgi:hypothetical protein
VSRWCGVLGLLARFVFLPHRLPKSQQKYIGGTSLMIGQQMRVTNQGRGRKIKIKAGMEWPIYYQIG